MKRKIPEKIPGKSKKDALCKLTTVKVPDQFAPLFCVAQEYVEKYFAGKKEDPERGAIEVQGERYILVRASAMSVDFFEIVKTLYRGAGDGGEIAQQLLFDIAHALGKADAKNFSQRMGVEDPIAKLSAGPIHFSYSGWAFVDIFPESKPTPDENYYLIYDHPYSFESDAWMRAGKKSDFPVCIMNAGYSSGWCEESFGVTLVAAEIMCIAKGDSADRFIMAHPSKIEKYIEEYTKKKSALSKEIKKYEIPGFFKRKQLEEDLQKRSRELENTKKALLNILEDIKERDAQLEQEKKKLQVTLESIGDGAFVVSVEKMIIFFNKAAEEITGYSREEVFGKEYRDALRFILEKDGSENFSFIEEAFKTGDTHHATNHMLLLSKSGKEIPILNSAAPIKDSDGKVAGVIVVFRDISEERAMEKARRDFISLSSHQLRTPLTSIKWMADMFLKGDLGKLTDQQREFMNDLYQSANRMAELITALLNIARIESAQLRVNSETINPKKIYQDVSRELGALSKAKGHKITFKKSKDLPEFKSDPRLLFEVLKNLLSNAIKYTPNKGEVEVFFSKKDKDALLSVKDNGFGIPRHQQDRVFQKFFRADNIVNLVTDGTGLGAYIVQQLVELLNGKIWFESEENKGTTFYVSLPIAGPKVRKGTKEIASSNY
jgi:PAS domain S-box-containing protein